MWHQCIGVHALPDLPLNLQLQGLRCVLHKVLQHGLEGRRAYLHVLTPQLFRMLAQQAPDRSLSLLHPVRAWPQVLKGCILKQEGQSGRAGVPLDKARLVHNQLAVSQSGCPGHVGQLR